MEPAWAQCYHRHFAQHFGKPFDVETFHSRDGLPLSIATYDQRYKQFRVYASLGMAEEVPKDTGEVILLADDFSKDVPFLLVNALFFVLQKNIPLGSRFAIGGVDVLRPDFAEAYDKAALFFTHADGFDEGFDRVNCEGEVGRVYQALFISAAELSYLQRRGPEEFDKAIRAHDAELCSVKRPSCV